MEKIKKMISTKDLAYICDIFNWNITASKKIEYMLEICEDEMICKELDKLNKMHLSYCENLKSLLEESDCNE
jgi:hypothetical protein